MKHSSIILLFLIFLLAFSYGQQAYRYTQPPELKDGWKTTSLQALDADTSRMYQLFNQLSTAQHNLHSMLLVKHDQVVLEAYFGQNDVEVPHDLRSVTKSITSLLMGIAIDQDWIEDIDSPVNRYVKTPVPEKNPDERKINITLRHLLSMSSGLDCNDWDKHSKGQEDRIYRKKDWLQYFLDLPVIHDPGTVASYCTMGQVLATEAISQASGMSIDTVAQQYLFDPLGISKLRWGHTSDKEVIPSAKRLYMTSRDLAKIGQLVLNKGQWNGRQIVSEAWIEASTTPQTTITGMDYGFLWWSIPFEVHGKRYIATAATGNGGQYLFIFPELEMVAVFTGGAYNSQEDKLPFAIVRDVFLPSFTTSK